MKACDVRGGLALVRLWLLLEYGKSGGSDGSMLGGSGVMYSSFPGSEARKQRRLARVSWLSSMDIVADTTRSKEGHGGSWSTK